MGSVLPPVIKPWKLLRSEVLYKHPLITLHEDTVVLPNGQETTWLCFGTKSDGVVTILRDEQGRILLARQYCHPPRAIVHEFPGGAIDSGETIEVAARRECSEEVGVYPRSLRHLGSFLYNNRRSATKLHVLLGTDLETRAAQAEPEEIIESAWVMEDKIDKMIGCGEIVNSILLSAWAIYKASK